MHAQRRLALMVLTVLPVIVLLVSPRPLPAAPGYTVLATESNNQHKLTAHRGRLYVTYTTRARGVPQIVVDTSADGRRWRSLGQASRGKAASTLSTLAIDAAGRLHVAWTGFEGGIGRIYYSRYDGRWSPPMLLSPATSYAGYPSLDADSRGRLHLAWYGIRQATAGQALAHGAIYEIYYVTFDGGWSRPRRISQGYPDAINPALAVDARDRVHVVWFQSDGQAYQIVHARRAAAWAAPVSITAGPANSTNPAIAVDGSGGVHVMWTRSDRIYFSTGVEGRWSEPVRLSADGARHPTVGIGRRGPFGLWQDTGGTIIVRTFDGRWGAVQRLGGGDYPNAAPWRPGSAARPVAAWTVPSGIKVAEVPVSR